MNRETRNQLTSILNDLRQRLNPIISEVSLCNSCPECDQDWPADYTPHGEFAKAVQDLRGAIELLEWSVAATKQRYRVEVLEWLLAEAQQ